MWQTIFITGGQNIIPCSPYCCSHIGTITRVQISRYFAKKGERPTILVIYNAFSGDPTSRYIGAHARDIDDVLRSVYI